MRKFRILVYEYRVLVGTFNILGTISDCFKISQRVLEEHPHYDIKISEVIEK